MGPEGPGRGEGPWLGMSGQGRAPMATSMNHRFFGVVERQGKLWQLEKIGCVSDWGRFFWGDVWIVEVKCANIIVFHSAIYDW